MSNYRIRYRGLYVCVRYSVARDGYIATVEKKDGDTLWYSTRNPESFPDRETAENTAKRIIDEMRAE